MEASKRMPSPAEASAVPRICDTRLLKTRLCRFNGMGICTKGAACTFAHSRDERRPNPDFKCTKLCPALEACNDPSCRFAHKKLELRTLVFRRPYLKRDPDHAPDDASVGSTEADSNTGSSSPERSPQPHVASVPQLPASPPVPKDSRDGQFKVSDESARSQPANFARTKLCKFYLVGCCLKRGACHFAHSDKDLRRPRDRVTKTSPSTMSSGAETSERAGSQPPLRPHMLQLPHQPPQPASVSSEAALKQHLDAYAAGHKQLAQQWLQALPSPAQLPPPSPWQAPMAGCHRHAQQWQQADQPTMGHAQQWQQALDQPTMGQPCFLPEVPAESELTGRPALVTPDALESAPAALPQNPFPWTQERAFLQAPKPVAFGAQQDPQSLPLRLPHMLQYDTARDEPMWCDASEFLSIGFQDHWQQQQVFAQQPSAWDEFGNVFGEAQFDQPALTLGEQAPPQGGSSAMKEQHSSLVELITLLVQQSGGAGDSMEEVPPSS